MKRLSRPGLIEYINRLDERRAPPPRTPAEAINHQHEIIAQGRPAVAPQQEEKAE